ncbi:MAG TPA: transcription-repair coupling factor [bacterium]|nr:transcription-repair coupling factor [bacterium]
MASTQQEITKRIFTDKRSNLIINKCLSEFETQIRGLSGSLLPLFLLELFGRSPSSVIAVCPDPDTAEALADEMILLNPETPVYFFPMSDFDASRPSYLNPREAGRQMDVLRAFSAGARCLVVTTPGGVIQPLPTPDNLRAAEIRLMPGARFDFMKLVERLTDYGYSREPVAERPGEISIRGGIFDIFPYTGEPPQRIEFFGNEIETIRAFDAETQMSTGPSPGFDVLPVPSEWGADRSSHLLGYPRTPLVFLDEPERYFTGLKSRDTEDPAKEEKENRFFSLVRSHTLISHRMFSSPKDQDFGGRPVKKTGRTVQEIRDLLHGLGARNRIFLVCEQEAQTARLRETLELDDQTFSNLSVDVVPLREGFDLPDLGVTVYTDRELFNYPGRLRRKPKFREGVPIRELSALSPGDYMVHIDYGIGRFAGLKKIEVNGSERECLSLAYQDGDALYVPVDKMERVQKYSGRDGVTPELTKLGTQKWETIKSRTKGSIKDMARDLIAIYAARETLPGHAFQPDTPWENELLASFAYEDTPDQNRATEEVKADMERPRPMDRLICGDVGYGKTEVAVRAAFKAVAGGKQAAVLVPTTVLAQQHHNTFSERLARFPVHVEMLSRFRNPAHQKRIVEKLKTGAVDIVIGTHRLLSGDIVFKDLGLLIIDEEHRFGVRHKEAIKALRMNVDVLALSATPIPRTLQLSLIHIRDMSLITTPPRDRLPIHTEVLPFDESVVAEAILREMARGGQVFFVHNRIESIHAAAEMLRRIVPGLRVGVAHGRMNAHELERVMVDFVDRKYDCLATTMIIESGIDMPHVNTLLVNRADRMGLAQLYQLRGRVGRSDQRAYAYLFTPPFGQLSPESIKRLRTIEEFTELGSGFQIAMRDLEIRGAGNLLGTRQSGFMDAVGFDLYTRLVREAVDEVKAEAESAEPVQSPAQTECSVDLSAAAFLPDDYVHDENLRVNLYRRLAAFTTPSDVDRFEDELRDRFGPVPPEAYTLLEVSRLRLEGQSRGVKRLMIDRKVLRLFFDETWMDSFASPEQFSAHLRSIIASSQYPVQFLHEKGFGLRMEITEDDPVAFAKKLLQRWG